MAGLAAILSLLLACSGSGLGWLLYHVLGLLGIVGIGWGGLYVTMAGEIGGRSQTCLASGFAVAAATVGVIIGPPLFGWRVDENQSYGVAWAAMDLSGFMGGGSAAFIRERRNLTSR
jgi:ACS family hexuronate transporter-like MFS transporter